MSRKYHDTIQLTEDALRPNDTHMYHAYDDDNSYYQSYWWDGHKWAEDQSFGAARIHYCKALALKYTGDTAGAVEHMEKAVEFDPGDNQAFDQLKLLKLELEQQRAKRMEKLNAPQIQLREKQARRKTKARG